MSKLDLYNQDCMEALREMEDNQFDLAIVDPPYGIGEDGGKGSRHHSQKKYIQKNWDREVMDEVFFLHLCRVSKNQIIWGANHFINNIPSSIRNQPSWVFWWKDRSAPGFSDGEFAWTSFGTRGRMVKYVWDGFRKQEPVNSYPLRS